jgi:hypothetical protein
VRELSAARLPHGKQLLLARTRANLRARKCGRTAAR